MKNKKAKNDKILKILESTINIQSNIVNFLILKPLDRIFNIIDKFDKQILNTLIIVAILSGAVLSIFGCINKDSSIIFHSLLLLIMGIFFLDEVLESLYNKYKNKQ